MPTRSSANASLPTERLGKQTITFVAEVENFVKSNIPCCVICVDVSSFFDALNHKYLKARLEEVLGVRRLASDWYAVFKALTRFSYVKKDDLLAIPVFASIIDAGFPKQIASIANVKKARIKIYKNDKDFGIPQGTPISAAASNAYVCNLDLSLKYFVEEIGGLYRRYSDDILVVVPADQAAAARSFVSDVIKDAKLDLNDEKTDINLVSKCADINFQYLGFNVDAQGATIRGSSLSRQSRKIAYAVRKTRKVGEAAIAAGGAKKYLRKN